MVFGIVVLMFSLMPMIKAVPRGQTCIVDAFLTPLIQNYIKDFISGFDESFLENVSLSFMKSDGGLSPVDSVWGWICLILVPWI